MPAFRLLINLLELKCVALRQPDLAQEAFNPMIERPSIGLPRQPSSTDISHLLYCLSSEFVGSAQVLQIKPLTVAFMRKLPSLILDALFHYQSFILSHGS